MPAWLLPGLIGAGSLLGNLFGGKAKANQASSQANLYNDWLKNYQGNAQNYLQQAMGQGFNPFGPKTSTTSGSQYSSGGSSTSFRNNPFITKQYAPLDELMRGIMQGRLSSGSSLPGGYAEMNARAINESFEGTDQAARNLAARRGLSPEQSYAVASPAARARAGALADMRASLPLLERQMQNEDIGITQGLQAAFGTGQEGRSNTNTFGNTFSSGTSSTPFGIGDLSSLVSLMAGPGPQQTTQSGYSGLGQGLGDASSILAWMMGNGMIGGGGQKAQGNPWAGVGMYT